MTIGSIYPYTEEVFTVVPEHGHDYTSHTMYAQPGEEKPESEWELEHPSYIAAQTAGEDMLRHYLISGVRLRGFSIRKTHKLVVS